MSSWTVAIRLSYAVVLCCLCILVADLGAMSGLVRAPFRGRFGRHWCAASSAIRARHRAPSGRGIERHRGAVLSAIGALHRAPSGRGIERHRGAASSAISARHQAKFRAPLVCYFEFVAGSSQPSPVLMSICPVVSLQFID